MREEVLAPTAGKMFHNSPFRQALVGGRRRQSVDWQRSGTAPARVRSHIRCHQCRTWIEKKRQARDLLNCLRSVEMCELVEGLPDVEKRSSETRVKKSLVRRMARIGRFFANNLFPAPKFARNLTRLQDTSA
jgi:hypothetical protein